MNVKVPCKLQSVFFLVGCQLERHCYSLPVFKTLAGRRLSRSGRQEAAASWTGGASWAWLAPRPGTWPPFACVFLLHQHLEPLGELFHANMRLSPCRLVTVADKEGRVTERGYK